MLDGLDWGTALLLAAILSPTDPVAVLSLFRQLHLDERLSVIIEGESLFNDGVAGSLYQTFLAIVLLSIQGHPSGTFLAWGEGVFSFLIEAGGGLLLGLPIGWLVSQIVKRIDEPIMETTLTIITAYGVYLVADHFHLSAITAVIAAALMLGNYCRRVGMSGNSQAAIDNFWSVLAFVANALIFLLVGVQLNPLVWPLVPGAEITTLLIAVFAVSVVLVARLVLVLILAARSVLVLSPRFKASGQYVPRSWRLVIFWSGLRGALSLALVLALPMEVPNRSVLLISTYAVVFFTLLIQGITLRWLLKRLPSLQQSSLDEDSSSSSEDLLEETSA
nr:cation:proton antiporter [Ktedonobacter sp. SOSP1-52]